MQTLYKEIPQATRAWSVFPYSEKLENRLQTFSRFGEPISLCEKRGENLFVARALFPISDNDKRVDGVTVTFESRIKPRDNEQARLMNETTSLLVQGESFITQSPTGSGKTIIALDAISKVCKKTIIVVTKEDLMGQWRERMQTFLNLNRKEIGIVQGDKCDVRGKKIILAMIHTLAKDKFPSYIFDDVGLVIFDECHRANASTFQVATHMFPAKLRLGLSAEPNRQDGKEIIFKSHIGPVRVIGEGLPMVPKVISINTKWRFPRKWDGTKLPHNPGKSMHITVIMAKDVKRNTLLAKWIYHAYKKGRNIIAFSDLAVDKHLGRMKQLLIKVGVPQKDIGYYIGGLTEGQRDKVKGKRIILATYGSTAEATDIPWLDFAIYLTPRANVLQPAGRVLREYPDKKIPIIIDPVDFDSGVYRKFYVKRKTFYVKIGAELKEKFK